MKIPRDINAKDLIKYLSKMGYEQSRQTGSHIRLTVKINSNLFHITIPNHSPIKIGTLNNILKEISNQLSISKDDLIQKLF
ncbi:MAG: type II toxin-antitoxin system HicA family toxin [Ignavibacteriota bacterium]